MLKKLLIISPTPSHPQNAGNRARIYSLMRNLQKLGCEVHFLHVQQEVEDDDLMRQAWGRNFYSMYYTRPQQGSLLQRIFRKIRELSIGYPSYPYAVDDWYDKSLDKLLIELQKKNKFDVVIVEYIFFSKALNCFSNSILKIIDTHDIFANRVQLYQDNNQELYWYSTTFKEEAKALRRADLIIAIQEKEEKYFKELGANRVITVGHTVPLNEPKPIVSIRKKILYLASWNEVNINGIKYFISEVLEELRSQLPEIQLLIGGKICEALEDSEEYIKLGRVEDLDEFYKLADVVINPVQFGTGLKIKSIEALGRSKALVTTSEGAKGLDAGIGKAFLVASNTDEFIQQLVRVLTDVTLINTLSTNAYLFAKNYNSSVLDPLAQAINSTINGRGTSAYSRNMVVKENL